MSFRACREIFTIVTLFLFTSLANAQGITQIETVVKTINDLKVGAYQTNEYLPLLKNKSVAIVANQSFVD